MRMLPVDPGTSSSSCSPASMKISSSRRLSKQVSVVTHFFLHRGKSTSSRSHHTKAGPLSGKVVTSDYFDDLTIGEPKLQSTSAMLSNEDLPSDLGDGKFAAVVRSASFDAQATFPQQNKPLTVHQADSSGEASGEHILPTINSEGDLIAQSDHDRDTTPPDAQNSIDQASSFTTLDSEFIERCVHSEISLIRPDDDNLLSADQSRDKIKLADQVADQVAEKVAEQLQSHEPTTKTFDVTPQLPELKDLCHEPLEFDDFNFGQYDSGHTGAFYERHSFDTHDRNSLSFQENRESSRELPPDLPLQSPSPPKPALMTDEETISMDECQIESRFSASDSIRTVEKSLRRSTFQSSGSARTISTWRPERLVSRASVHKPDIKESANDESQKAMTSRTIREMRTLQLDAKSVRRKPTGPAPKITGLPRLLPVHANVQSG